MKSIGFARRVWFVLIAGSLLSGAFARSAAAQGSPLNLTITRSGQTIFLSWPGENGLAYQLESSVDALTWQNFGPLRFGTGVQISVMEPIAGIPRRFFRLTLPAVWAIFNPQTGLLTVGGDNSDNTIVVRREVAGNIVVNNGAVVIGGGTPTVGNTGLIEIFGRAGHDQISIDETNGAMPAAEIFGEGGNDTITGGSGGDFLDGGPGNDSLLGKGGFDTLRGGNDNDTLTGGDADDQVFGDAGTDRMIWNPGDDTDLNEGGTEVDTVEVNGGGADEQFTATANGIRVRFDRTNPAPFTIDIGTTERLVVNMSGGADSFAATGDLASLIQITVDGGIGTDLLLGSNGMDVLMGGDNDDFIDGQQGNDTVFMGAGNDTFQWDPGDGSDTIEGQADTDTLLFNGSGGSEIFEALANGQRVRFTRNLGNIVMDLDDVENLEVNALGATDLFTINDLSGTDMTGIIADLTLAGIGDTVADTVIIRGTAGDDIVTLTLPGGDLLVSGLAASVTVDGVEPPLDTVRIEGLSGDDIVDASGLPGGGPLLVLDGGFGNDILLGGAGNDTILGGDNDDVLFGNGGTDTLDGGTGANIIFDGATTVTTGIITVFGDGVDNNITISRDAAGNILSNGIIIPGATVANTSLIRVFGMAGHDVITLNEALGALPPTTLFGGAGNDILIGGAGGDLLFGGSNVDNLQGKTGFDILFGGADSDTLTGGDADDQVYGEAGNDRMVWNPGDDTDLNEGGTELDTVEVNGGGGAEQFTTTANGSRVRFDRTNPAPFTLDIGTSEDLVLNANGGDDMFSATGNLAVLIEITVDGGAGDDTLLGSNGVDVLLGGDNNDFVDGQQGNDVAFLGAGNDTFQWDPGDGSDTIEGQADTDTLLFNGSGGAEIFDASANGQRVRFTRNLGNIVMDTDDLEQISVRALGGTDSLIVNGMAGTDLASIDIDLASTIGGSAGDAATDIITVNGTAAPDAFSVTANAGTISVSGLAAVVRIVHSEVANDDLILNGLGGADTFSIGPGVTALIDVITNQ